MRHVEKCRKAVGRTVQSNGNDKAMKVDRGSVVATDLVCSGVNLGGGRLGGIRAWQTSWAAGVGGGLDVIRKGGSNPGRQDEEDGF